MTTAAQPTPDPGAVANFEKSTELDKALRAVLKKKGFYDPEARSLRTSLRDCYEAVILTDLDFAALKDVEQHLWWNVFYRPIEEFRTKHRKAAEKGADQEAVQKLTASYLKFLEEAKAYYRRLVVALQRTYGDVGVWDASETEQPNPDAERMQGNQAAKRDCRLSVHRCLICLGDLLRYHASLVRTSKAEWRAAAQHYRLAARVHPSSGNPFNQLAVMAYYTNDELRAVYYYFRSLAVKAPFATARENLLMLFERSRAKLKQQQQQGYMEAPGQDPRKSAVQNAIQEVANSFVRVHGLLYDKINMEQFEDLKHKAMAQLDSLLANRDALEAIAGQPAHDQMFLHLAVLAVFSICSYDHRPGEQAGPQPPYAEVMQRAALKRSALCTMFGMGAHVMRAASVLPPGHVAHNSLLVAVHLLMRWLASRTDIATGGKSVDGKEAAARVAFWRAAAALLRRMQHKPLQESEADICLPEELDLQGFEPLGWQSAGPPDVRAKPEDSGSVRASRILQHCTTLAAALASSQVIAAHSHHQGVFGISAGEEQVLQDSIDQFCAAVRAAHPVAPQPQPAPEQAAAAQDDMADEEVIVFRPQSASRPGSSVGDEAAQGPLTRPASSSSLQAMHPEEPKALPFSLFDDTSRFNFGLQNVLPTSEEVDASLGLIARHAPAAAPTRPATTPAPSPAFAAVGATPSGASATIRQTQAEDHSLLGLFAQRRVATAPPATQAYRPATGPSYLAAQHLPAAPAAAHGTSAPMPNELPSPAVLKPRTSVSVPATATAGTGQPHVGQQQRALPTPTAGLFSDAPAFPHSAQTSPADSTSRSSAAAAGGSASQVPTPMDYLPFGGMPPPSYDLRQLNTIAAPPPPPMLQMLPRSASAGTLLGPAAAAAVQQSILSVNSGPTTSLPHVGQPRAGSTDLLQHGFQTGSSPGPGAMRDSSGSWAAPAAAPMMEAGELVENDPELRELQLLGQQAAFMVVGDDEGAADVSTMWRPPSITAGMGAVGLRGSSTGPATPTSSFTLFSGRSSPFPDLAAQANVVGWNAAAVTMPQQAASHLQQGLPLHLLEERMLRQAASFPPHGAPPQANAYSASLAHNTAEAGPLGGQGNFAAPLQASKPAASPLAEGGQGYGALLQSRNSAGSTLQSVLGGGVRTGGGFGLDGGHNRFGQLGLGGVAPGGSAGDLLQLQGMTGPTLRPTKNVFQTANPFVP